jgi:hypothetical protein
MNDWGNLLLTFIILHAYLAFSQFIIVWSGNLPREIHWYLERTAGGWGATELVLIVLQLFLPFFLLLFRSVKQHRKTLGITAGIVLVAQWIEFAWLTMPSLKEDVSSPYATLLALAVMALATAAIGLLMFPAMRGWVRPGPAREVAR